MIYVMSDIHGQYDAFIRMLNFINFSSNDILYILGDVIDRGPDGVPLLEYCMQHENVVLLIGNHEKMMLDAIEKQSHFDYMLWYENGGLSTDECINNQNKKRILDYVHSLPYYKEITVNQQKYMLIHAGLEIPHYAKEFQNFTVKNLMEWNVANENILWLRKEPLTWQARERLLSEYKIIHGHTPQSAPCYFENGVMNIDTGVAKLNKLTCYNITANKIYSLNIKADEFEEVYEPYELFNRTKHGYVGTIYRDETELDTYPTLADDNMQEPNFCGKMYSTKQKAKDNIKEELLSFLKNNHYEDDYYQLQIIEIDSHGMLGRTKDTAFSFDNGDIIFEERI